MKPSIPLLLCILLLASPLFAAPNETVPGEGRNCRKHGMKMDCDSAALSGNGEGGTCNPGMRGRCGKRRGDWYGASQPVSTTAEAHKLLSSYYGGQGYTVSDVTEKKWGFRADILDKDGKLIDRAMIDKRSGRIRSLY